MEKKTKLSISGNIKISINMSDIPILKELIHFISVDLK